MTARSRGSVAADDVCRNGHRLADVGVYVRPRTRFAECRACRREAAGRRRSADG